jgi:beta-glucosidase
MRNLHRKLVLLSGVILFILPVTLFAQRINPQELQPLSQFNGFPKGAVYQNPKLKPAERARNLISFLSFEQKMSFTGGYLGFCFPGIKNLGIRPVIMADASQGIRLESIASEKEVSTSFPSMQALAATFNPALAGRFGTAIGEECKQHGVDILLGPGINMQRLSEGGRNYEYLGEDPLLTTKIAVPYVKGLQSGGVIATAKHFICNDVEFIRHIVSSDVDERTLREFYLPPWKALIQEADLKAIMSGNNLVNSIPNSMHKPLIQDILRDEYGFKGIAMTDWQNTNYFPSLQYLATTSGLSLMMPENNTFADYIKTYLILHPNQKPKIEKELDEMIFANLSTFFAAGIYDRNPVDKGMLGKIAEHKIIAQKTAEEAICLLKNENQILPIARNKKILLTGKPEIFTGEGAGYVAGFDHIDFSTALKQVYGKQLIVTEKPTDEQIKNADAVIFRLSKDAGEGYDIPFTGPDSAHNAIKNLCKLNPNVIVLISSANGLELPWLNDVKGILWTFMLGQERGTALSNIISGKVSPSGKLPFTLEKSFQDSPDPDFNFLGGKPYWKGANSYYKEYWKATNPKATSEISKFVQPNQLVHMPYSEGVFVGYRWYEKYNKPIQFPFGYGLSYTQFNMSDLTFSSDKIKERDSIQIAVTVKNTGKMYGAEVVQLYVSDLNTKIQRPIKELKAFEKVFLKPGEQRKINFNISKQDLLAYWSNEKHKWEIQEGSHQILIGNSSANIQLKKDLLYSSNQ